MTDMKEEQTPYELRPPKGAVRSFLREPLMHFVVLGALVFALDQTVLHINGDPMKIEVPDSVTQEAKKLLASSLQREPTAKELKPLVDRWIDNEILYREGLSMGLDKGDSAIRDRVIFKALNITQAGLTLPRQEEDNIKAWFLENRARYDEPMRFDFMEATVAGERGEAKLRAFADFLNGKGTMQLDSSLNVFKDRPRRNIEQSYGEGFALQLEKATAGGDWLVVESTSGWRVVRLMQIKAAVPVEYDSVKSQVLQDWKDEAVARQTTKAIRDLGARYRIVRPVEAP